jgi:hypothetical protein
LFFFTLFFFNFKFLQDFSVRFRNNLFISPAALSIPSLVKIETESNLYKIIENFKNQGRCETYNDNIKKETERYIVNHKNELKENLITDIPFSVSEIKKCINKLKMKKSVGPDHICNEVIKFSSIV